VMLCVNQRTLVWEIAPPLETTKLPNCDVKLKLPSSNSVLDYLIVIKSQIALR